MPRSTARMSQKSVQRAAQKTAQPDRAPRPPYTPPPARPSHTAGIAGARPANGTVRECTPQRGELLRHRVMSADGRDVAVTTTTMAQGYTTGVYPVQSGYLVMVRQPLHEINSATIEAAREEHAQLVRVLAELGVRLLRARRHRDPSDQVEPVEQTPVPTIVQAPTSDEALVRIA